MKSFSIAVCLLLLPLFTMSAQAELFSFTYTFDANGSGTAGHELSGVIDGRLLNDGDTVLIKGFVTVSLAGIPYDLTNSIQVRAADPANAPVMSLSGDNLDFWVCAQGFTEPGLNDGGDCPFTTGGGGFLVSDNLTFGDPNIVGWAIAGIPELGQFYRDRDQPLNADNWQAEALDNVKDYVSVSFSYAFDANQSGTAGHVLEGLAEGYLYNDGDTVEFVRLNAASLAGVPYLISHEVIGMRGFIPGSPATMSLSGNVLDFWICPLGFSQVNPGIGGGDCPFGTEGGFLISDILFFPFDASLTSWGIAGLPELGASYRDRDQPLNTANWTAVMTKIKPLKPKKFKKPKSKGPKAK